jgi:sec-independent protein translocase protein TatB
MLDFSWTHILILLIVALVVVGPKDLPPLMRMLGQWAAKARAMANEFRKSFDEMARQSELDELRKEIASLREERPLADLDRNILPPDEGAPPETPAVPEAQAAPEEAAHDAAALPPAAPSTEQA